jgi:hypothetical protein
VPNENFKRPKGWKKKGVTRKIGNFGFALGIEDTQVFQKAILLRGNKVPEGTFEFRKTILLSRLLPDPGGHDLGDVQDTDLAGLLVLQPIFKHGHAVRATQGDRVRLFDQGLADPV